MNVLRVLVLALSAACTACADGDCYIHSLAALQVMSLPRIQFAIEGLLADPSSTYWVPPDSADDDAGVELYSVVETVLYAAANVQRAIHLCVPSYPSITEGEAAQATLHLMYEKWQDVVHLVAVSGIHPQEEDVAMDEVDQVVLARSRSKKLLGKKMVELHALLRAQPLQRLLRVASQPPSRSVPNTPTNGPQGTPFGPIVSAGITVPAIAFGTADLLPDGDSVHQCVDAVLQALRIGYRHFDTAESYGTEQCIADAIARSGVARRDLFLTSKLSSVQSYTYAGARKAVRWQLQALRTHYIDLYLVHNPRAHMDAAWRALQELQKEGALRLVGVSNFNVRQLEALQKRGAAAPQVVQNKFDPYHRGHVTGHDDVAGWCRRHGIAFFGYGLISGWPFELQALADPHVQTLAERYRCTPAQLLIRWALQEGVGAVVAASDPQHMRDNLRAANGTECARPISEADMARLRGLGWGVATPVAHPPEAVGDVHQFYPLPPHTLRELHVDEL